MEYVLTDTSSGYAVVRSDGAYAEFLDHGEADEAALLLESGGTQENEYDWHPPQLEN